MNLNNGRIHVAVISKGRPHTVPVMQQHARGMGPVTWYVGAGEAQAYLAQGAQQVVEAGGLCQARNLALDDAFRRPGRSCLQLSDDLIRVEMAENTPTGPAKRQIDLRTAVEMMMAAALTEGAFLVGCAPTSNLFYWSGREIRRNVFVVGDCVLVLPTPIRWDEQMPVKEDYDYTCQHVARYGVAVRRDDLLLTFRHRSNPGGACTPDRPVKERIAIARLMEKWPGCFRPNTRRENELLMDRKGMEALARKSGQAGGRNGACSVSPLQGGEKQGKEPINES